MILNKNIVTFFIVISLVILSCRENDNYINYPDIEDNQNIPVVLNSTNIFTFSINAYKYSNYLSDRLFFNTDSISVTIVLKNVIADTSFVEIYNQKDELIFSNLLSKDLILYQDSFSAQIPYYFKMQLLNFTGNMTFVLTDKKKNDDFNN